LKKRGGKGEGRKRNEKVSAAIAAYCKTVNTDSR
jgi:hypothetical protein